MSYANDPHVYASPWCVHNRHDDCDGKCPVCRRRCWCDCHDKKAKAKTGA